MSGPTESVKPTDGNIDAGPISPSEKHDGGAVSKQLTSVPSSDAYELLSDGSDSDDTACPSQGLDSWSMADSSWNPADLRAEGERSPVSPSKRAGRRPPAISEEREGEAPAGGPANDLLRAAGGAAATAAAAAAAANAVAAQQRMDSQPSPESTAQLPNVPLDDGAAGSARTGDAAGGQSFRAPPGLADPSQLPSRGSGMHCSGDCSPCVWHWKPQGCFRGRECGYCHLCPEGEIKMRKKAKLATLRSGSRGLDGSEENEDKDLEGEESPKKGGGQGMPSVGSALHGTGECRPCAWFWKPQGCQNAQDCRHCHLCPEGEIKFRKKMKAETMRKDQEEEEATEEDGEDRRQQDGAKAPQEPQDPREPLKVVTRDIPGDSGYSAAIPPPPGLAEPAVLKVPSLDTPAAPAQAKGEPPSAGSVAHGTGECRPCAWFWKPQGCQNGRECRHCHLCPEGEIKARKKEKAGSVRQDRQLEPEEEPVAPVLSEPLLSACASPIAMPFLPLLMPPPALPSIGSSLHGTGRCRPCAWFWKPQGCENGRECCHCHLCPSGEIKARRKIKIAVLRHQGPLQEQLEMQQEEMEQWEAQWEAQQQAVVSFYLDQEAEEATPATEAASPSPQADGSAGAQSPFMLPVPLDLAASLDNPLPSTGSALHSLGKCRPCAWFWKVKGCLNGQACAHCHLCPEGELKVRKKVKETAMRIGALMPARRSLDARSPRVVKIAPVLGA